jgi:hypothetical protein
MLSARRFSTSKCKKTNKNKLSSKLENSRDKFSFKENYQLNLPPYV